MMKSTGIVRKSIFTAEGKIGVVKDLIIETGPCGQELISPNLSKGFTSPDWWISALEVELDETFKNDLVASKKLAPTKAAETFTLKLAGFGRGAVNLTEKGIEIKATKAQAGDNIGTLDAFYKPAITAKPKIPFTKQ